MSFFDESLPEPPPEPVFQPPPWWGPPRGVLPGYSPQRAVLFKTEEAILMAHRFLAYPNGVEFTLTLLVRDPSEDLGDVPWELHQRPSGNSPPDEFLRFGILFSDGAKWTNLDWRHPSIDDPPSGPVVIGRGGGGGGNSWEMSYWMWPLPPEGALTLVVSWPARGIVEQRADVDAGEIRDRSSEAETIWEDVAPGTGGWHGVTRSFR